ncbi:MAG: VWA domain-containing protein [Candidatus Woesearchaeota archaeon]
MIHGSATKKTEIKKTEEIEELSGKLNFSVEKKLMHSVLENDQTVIDEAKIIKDSINQSLFSFTPDLMFEKLVKNYKMAKQLFGEKLIRQMTGYDEEYVENNIRIPEFQREIKKKMQEKFESMKEKGILTKHGDITDKGIELAALLLYTEELDSLDAQGFLGEKFSKNQAHYGMPVSVRQYHKGDRYKDIALRNTLKTAIRRQHGVLFKDDIRIFSRESKGKISIIYGLDASGSMKGVKIETCKKAGVALAFKALEEKDEVGLIVFGQDIQHSVAPCNDFGLLLKEITKIQPSKETNLAACILHSLELFHIQDATKHLLLLTDAIPTVGEDPAKATLEAAEKASAAGITISLIGIQLDKKGKELAEKIVQFGKGRLYIVDNLNTLDKIVLMDYYGC